MTARTSQEELHRPGRRGPEWAPRNWVWIGSARLRDQREALQVAQVRQRRLHERPNAEEIRACRPWFEAEVLRLAPWWLWCSWAPRAAQSALGRAVRRIGDQPGLVVALPIAPHVIVTLHPSAVLRSPNPEARELASIRLVPARPSTAAGAPRLGQPVRKIRKMFCTQQPLPRESPRYATLSAARAVGPLAGGLFCSARRSPDVTTQPLVLVADDEPRITKLVSISLGKKASA